MTTFHNVVKIEIQNREVQIKKIQAEVKTLRGILSTNSSGDAAAARVATGRYPKKSLPHHVKRIHAEDAFQKMPVVFTVRELAHQLRDALEVVITDGCAYNWLRNFLDEGLVKQGPRIERFHTRSWMKTERGKIF